MLSQLGGKVGGECPGNRSGMKCQRGMSWGKLTSGENVLTTSKSCELLWKLVNLVNQWRDLNKNLHKYFLQSSHKLIRFWMSWVQGQDHRNFFWWKHVPISCWRPSVFFALKHDHSSVPGISNRNMNVTWTYDWHQNNPTHTHMHTQTKWKNIMKTCFHEYFDNTGMTFDGCPHQRSHEIHITAFNLCPTWHLLQFAVNTTAVFSVRHGWDSKHKPMRSNKNIQSMYSQRNAFSATSTNDKTHEWFADRSVATHCCHGQRCCLVTVHCIHLATRCAYQHLCSQSHLPCITIPCSKDAYVNISRIFAPDKVTNWAT